ncbi:hypothetical protein JQ617_21360 [Bradyrhizobium sp. KB893862 SZCCT0404]|uniref:hypothetical protein n=1 Tax=Bradyrhizobium sp. KB893862 SZCCT0404 TaxID=2807672 RepID=UPI001BA65D93|nr:hypothetical protein [Bradyrhizobium sp. KB893862 SZCCT0404]MBR1176517.1 hypothetical protein [Bradyrhizobium sp. KB893862 SZCCT0404]
MLLPGLCTETFFGFELHKPNDPPLVVIAFNAALVGVALAVMGIVIGINRLAAGLILLLPGACTVVASGGYIGRSSFARITPITFTVAFVGLILILIALAQRR